MINSQVKTACLESDLCYTLLMKRVWLTCIIALPEKLFFNTGIATYIWILTNRYFYQYTYTPLHSLKEITDELLKLGARNSRFRAFFG